MDGIAMLPLLPRKMLPEKLGEWGLCHHRHCSVSDTTQHIYKFYRVDILCKRIHIIRPRTIDSVIRTNAVVSDISAANAPQAIDTLAHFTVMAERPAPAA